MSEFIVIIADDIKYKVKKGEILRYDKNLNGYYTLNVEKLGKANHISDFVQIFVPEQYRALVKALYEGKLTPLQKKVLDNKVINK